MFSLFTNYVVDALDIGRITASVSVPDYEMLLPQTFCEIEIARLDRLRVISHSFGCAAGQWSDHSAIV